MKIILKQMFILFITMIPAMIPAVMVMTLCDLINLPEGPVYIVSTNLYSILWLLLYRYSTNHSRKKKLKGLVNTRELRPIEWIRCCLIVLGGSLAFSLFTEWIIDVINLLFGKQVITSDSVGDLIENIPVYWLILCVVIIAPIIEEILFRQLLLENLLPYGTCKAVLLSGVLFGVMHLNAEQSLYSIFVGSIFGAVVVRTGEVKYAIYLHMMTNLFGGVIFPRLPVERTVMISIALVLGGLVSAGIEINKYIRKKYRFNTCQERE